MSSAAESMFAALRGIFCIYKPSGRSMQSIVKGICRHLTRDLNIMPCRPVRQMVQIGEPLPGSDLPVITTVPDLSDHPLVVGPRYILDDFNVTFADGLATDASGVTVMSINTPNWLRNIIKAQYIRVYHLKGELGRATHDFSGRGKLIERTTYHHVTPAKIDRVIAAIQAGHQKQMFHAAGVDPESQEAYDLAVQGLVRPKSRDAGTIIYGVKCVEFDRPHFTLEVHAVNETDDYLHKMVHELGLEMKASAVCTHVRRIRYGQFMLDHSLLHKHWHAEHIVENIRLCRPLVGEKHIEHQPLIKHRHFDQKLGLLEAC